MPPPIHRPHCAPPPSAADVNLLRRADAAGKRLFRELVASRIAWTTVSEVSRLIAVDVVGFSMPAGACDHPAPCRMEICLDHLQMRAMLGNRTAALPSLSLAAGEGLGGRVLAGAGALSVDDYRTATASPRLAAMVCDREGLGAMAAVPVTFGGAVRAVLHVGRRHRTPFTAGLIEALSHVATYAGAALAAAGDRARLEEVATMRERRRLTRALHDDFAQRLFGIAAGVRVARERATTGHPELITQLLALEQEVTTATSALRSTMRALDTPATPAGALAVTLREDVSSFERRTAIPAHLIVLGESPPIDAERTDVLVRACREGLRNVERHAAAAEVVVTLCIDAASAEVVVQDDGTGPGERTAGSRLGLSGLREELERLGGGLRLSHNDDLGSSLRLWLPLR